MADTGFIRPSLETLIQRIEADLNTRLPGGDSRVRRSVLSVLARTLAGAVHGLYGFLDFIARQAIIDTAISEFLERWASIWGKSRKAATKASGTGTVEGTNGSAINIGTLLQRGDGVQFVTTTAQTVSGGTATLDLEALEAGENGNTDADTQLLFVSPISGVNAICTSGELTGGTDTEEDDDLRARLLQRIQEPPHGGSASDYEQWALEVPGVTRAWPYALELGAGTVTVRFMMDDTYDDGIPLSGDVETVQAYIDSPYRRPVTADVTVVAPIPVELDFDIELKKLDGTAETSPTVRAAVEAELFDLIRREAEPGGTILISHIREAISVAAGEADHVLLDPVADVTHTTGEIAVPGEISWS